ncbi:MAG: tetratricopeptide repeat protein [bacterium]
MNRRRGKYRAAGRSVPAALAVFLAAFLFVRAPGVEGATVISCVPPGAPAEDAELTRALNLLLSYRLEAFPDFPLVDESAAAVTAELSTEKLWRGDEKELEKAFRAMGAAHVALGRHRASHGKITSTVRFHTKKDGAVTADEVVYTGTEADFEAFTSGLFAAFYTLLERRLPHNPEVKFPSAGTLRAFGHFARGAALMEQGNENSALGELEKALREAPRSRDVHYYLGKYYVSRQFQYDRAIGHFQKILEYHPGDAPTLFWLGFTRYAKGDRTGAIAAFEAAKKVKPRDPDILSYLGALYAEEGDFAGAAENYGKALESSPRNALMWYQLASVYAKSGMKDAALDALDRCLELEADVFLGMVLHDADFAGWKKDADFSAMIKRHGK